MNSLLPKISHSSIQTIGVILSLIIAAYFGIKAQESQDLDAILITNTQLVNISPDVRKDIIINYRTEPVAGINYLKFRFENTGDDSIRKDDFAKDISIKLGDTRRIVNFIHNNSGETSVELKLSEDRSQLLLNWDLLNDDQGFDLEIFSINADGSVSSQIPIEEIDITSLINGIKSINFKEKVDDPSSSTIRSIASHKFKGALVGVVFAVSWFWFLVIVSVIKDDYKLRKNPQPGKTPNSLRLLLFFVIVFAIPTLYSTFKLFEIVRNRWL